MRVSRLLGIFLLFVCVWGSICTSFGCSPFLHYFIFLCFFFRGEFLKMMLDFVSDLFTFIWSFFFFSVIFYCCQCSARLVYILCSTYSIVCLVPFFFGFYLISFDVLCHAIELSLYFCCSNQFIFVFFEGLAFFLLSFLFVHFSLGIPFPSHYCSFFLSFVFIFFASCWFFLWRCRFTVYVRRYDFI